MDPLQGLAPTSGAGASPRVYIGEQGLPGAAVASSSSSSSSQIHKPSSTAREFFEEGGQTNNTPPFNAVDRQQSHQHSEHQQYETYKAQPREQQESQQSYNQQQSLQNQPQQAYQNQQQSRTTGMKSEEEQSLALKVMRLYKPKMDESGIHLGLVGFDPKFYTNGTGGQLLLPGSFGQIYIGQVFSCYMSVCNNGRCEQVRNVVIRAELEAGGNRIELRDKREPAGSEAQMFGVSASVSPSDTVDFVFQQELTSVGTHTLRVNVQFDSAFGRRSIRKHFRFEVNKPLSFTAEFHPLPCTGGTVEENSANSAPGLKQPCELGSEKVLSQVVVSNLTKSNLLLASLEMIPMQEGFQAVQLSLPPYKPNDSFSAHAQAPVLLAPGASRNFLFMVFAKKREEGSAQRVLLQSGSQLARILSRWTTDFAEPGRLMSQPLAWKTPSSQPTTGHVTIEVPHPTKPFVVGECTPVSVKISNLLDKEIDAELRIDTHQGEAKAGVLFVGNTTTSLGILGPKRVETVVCQALPLSPGLHMLAGISVLDKRTNQSFTPDQPPVLFVT